jgi:hypothetical protein
MPNCLVLQFIMGDGSIVNIRDMGRSDNLLDGWGVETIDYIYVVICAEILIAPQQKWLLFLYYIQRVITKTAKR